MRLPLLNTTVLRWVAWGIVLFYALASGRGFLPGLCATLNAAERSCSAEDEVLANATRSCCSAPEPADAPGQGSKRPITPEESGCPFCHLVQTACETPTYPVMPDVATPTFAAPLSPVSPLPRDIVFADAPKRAPPC